MGEKFGEYRNEDILVAVVRILLFVPLLGVFLSPLSYLMRYSETRKLLWTIIEVTVISEQAHTPDRITQVFEYFASVEEEFSRFLPESSLSLLNRHKIARVSSRFLKLMDISKNMYQETGGLFNPLASAAKLGYTHSFEEGNFEPSVGVIDTDFDAVRIEGDTITLQPEQSLDFGGIAKGWAVDGAASLLRSFGYDNFFVNAWGDISASGNHEDTDTGWIIGIENPFTGEVIASVTLRDAAIATSGSYKRNWEIDGEMHHHLINPFTGENENTVISVALIAPKCVTADGFTKSVFNVPVPEGLRLMEQNGMEGMVFTTSGELFCTKGLEEKYSLVFAEREGDNSL